MLQLDGMHVCLSSSFSHDLPPPQVQAQPSAMPNLHPAVASPDSPDLGMVFHMARVLLLVDFGTVVGQEHCSLRRVVGMGRELLGVGTGLALAGHSDSGFWDHRWVLLEPGNGIAGSLTLCGSFLTHGALNFLGNGTNNVLQIEGEEVKRLGESYHRMQN